MKLTLIQASIVAFRRNEIRAWRRVLDPHKTYQITRSTFTQYCRTVQFGGNCLALWTYLDRDGDFYITHIEEYAGHLLIALQKPASVRGVT